MGNLIPGPRFKFRRPLFPYWSHQGFLFLLNFSPLKNKNKKYVATPNKTVPHQGWIFQNSKTIFPFHSTLLFKKRDSELSHPSGSGEGPQIGDSAGDQTHNL